MSISGNTIKDFTVKKKNPKKKLYHLLIARIVNVAVDSKCQQFFVLFAVALYDAQP